MDAKVLYLYQVDDRIVIRAERALHHIRIEIAATDDAHTRIAVTCRHGRDVDRAVSGQVIASVEERLNPRVATPPPSQH